MNRSLVLLVAVVVGGFGFGFYKVGIAPRLDERAKLDEQLVTQQQVVADAQGQLAAAREAKRDYRRNAAALVELGKAVPADADTGALVFQLQTEARRAGVSLRTFSASASTDGSAAPTALAGLTAVPLELRFRGDFFALDRVLRRIRGFVRTGGSRVGIDGRLLVVRSIDIAPDGGTDASGKAGPANQVATTLKVVAFVRDSDAPTDAAATAAPPADGAAPTPTPTPASAGPVSDQ